MPVRTSAVVAGGLVLLTLIGITTIFGDSLLALVAPPPLDAVSSAPGPATITPGAGPPAARPLAARSPAGPDGGRAHNPAGNP